MWTLPLAAADRSNVERGPCPVLAHPDRSALAAVLALLVAAQVAGLAPSATAVPVPA
jgi:hypothetical protein